MGDTFLHVSNLTKAFGPTVALRDVSLEIAAGETVGLVGENGAGKSTLMKILGGVTSPDSGTIITMGKNFPSLTVRQSMGAGIAFVHQELNLFENLTVAANIFIGREQTKGGFLKLVDTEGLSAMARPFLEDLGAEFGPDELVGELSLGQRQLVEIAKALSQNARVVIMDEPTSSLTLAETEKLMQVIAHLKARNVSVIFISHRLNEVRQCCDRVWVLRDGQTVAELRGTDIEPATMVRHMIGRELKSIYRPPAGARGPVVLRLQKICTQHRPDEPVDLALHAGEILGLAGLVGAGRSELATVIAGLDMPLSGQVLVGDNPVTAGSPGAAISRGLYLVPEDRKGTGLILDLPIAQNVSLADLRRHASYFLIDGVSEEKAANLQRDKLSIRCASVQQPTTDLSGGNQQKVALAKWLSMEPRVMILDEPTRGVDVGAKDEIYRIMRGLADHGVAILMISSDMEEVIGVSDRVAVMHEGRITGYLDRDELSEERILSLAIGREQQAAA
jgi:ribose transport system ATP-binding protein